MIRPASIRAKKRRLRIDGPVQQNPLSDVRNRKAVAAMMVTTRTVITATHTPFHHTFPLIDK